MITKNFQGWVLNLIFETISSNRQYIYRISDQSDKIIVWLVGFSITSIALSISKESELNLVIKNLTNYIIIFGSLTVIFGILYRIFLYLAQSLEITILIAFEGYINGYNNPPNIHFGRELTDENTYDDIITFIKDDFEIEIERTDISILNSDQIAIFRKSVFDYYLSLNNFENKKLEKGKNEIKNILSKYLGYSKRKLENIFNPKASKVKSTNLFWFCHYTASILFVLSCLAFTSGIFTILIEFLKKVIF